LCNYHGKKERKREQPSNYLNEYVLFIVTPLLMQLEAAFTLERLSALCTNPVCTGFFWHHLIQLMKSMIHQKLNSRGSVL